VVAPVDHEYEVPLAAVSVTDPPEQKVVLPLVAIVAVGAAFIVTVVLAVEEPQPFVNVTV